LLKISIMKIGFVDDHPFILQGYKNVLKDWDCVISANNGMDMIKQFENLNQKDLDSIPSIMIVDINMPEMDGFEVVQWLKVNYPKIKIIISSMSNDENTILRMIKMGVESYIVKSDLTYEVLKDVVYNVWKNGNFYTPRVTELIIKSFQSSMISEVEKKILNLTEKEKIIIKLICDELTSSEIASRLFVSVRTIETITHNIFSKLEVKNRVGVALFAIRNGILN